MATIQLTCGDCGSPFLKDKREYDRQIRRGRLPDDFYCSPTCAARAVNRESPHTDGLLRGNPRPQIDQLSPFRWFVIRARYRDSETDLDPTYLKEIWEKQGGLCVFSGQTMLLPRDTNGFMSHEPSNASLDRVDNGVRYRRGNVRFVSLIANLARQQFSDDQLLQFCSAVVFSKHDDPI